MSSADDLLFGKIALNMHFITKDLLDRALQFQQTQAPGTPLGELLLQKNVLNRDQIEKILEYQRRVKTTRTRAVPQQTSGEMQDSWPNYPPPPGPGNPAGSGGRSSYNSPSPMPAMPSAYDLMNPGHMSAPGAPNGASGMRGAMSAPGMPGMSAPGMQGMSAPGMAGGAPGMQPGMPAPADGADNLIGLNIGGCVIVTKIGEGGMGAIYRARHEALRKDVVVKILPPESAANPRTVERFGREARAAAKLEHPNIVQVLNVGTTDRGLHFIIMQYIDGKNLEDVIQEKGRHAWRDAVRITIEVARGLQAAHAAGVIHRDIKADNILLTNQGVVKLADFGLAKDLNSDMKLTADGAMIGTPLYMAPEIGRVKEIDGRVDVYSLGVTFYYLLTGVQPFRAFPAIEILSAKAHDKLKAPEAIVPDLPDPVRNVLGKMLERDRDKRYPDCDSLLRDLEALDRGFPVEAGEPSLWGARGSLGASGVAKSTGKTGKLATSTSKRVPAAQATNSSSGQSAAAEGIGPMTLMGIVTLVVVIVVLLIVIVANVIR